MKYAEKLKHNIQSSHDGFEVTGYKSYYFRKNEDAR